MLSQACHRERLSHALLQAPCCVGTDRVRPLHASRCCLRRAFGPGSSQTPGPLCPLVHRQLLQHVAPRVNPAALDQGRLSKHFFDSSAKRLGSIQNDAHGDLGVQALLAQIGQPLSNYSKDIPGIAIQQQFPMARHLTIILIHRPRRVWFTE